jgi:hypothetical protein
MSNEAIAVLSPESGYLGILIKFSRLQVIDGEILYLCSII